MEQIHRKHIDDLIEIVPCFIDMVVLWPYSIKTGIFNEDDCNIPTWSRKLNKPEIIKDIFSTNKTRGPGAYKNLILSLRLSNHIVIADMLDIMNEERKIQKRWDYEASFWHCSIATSTI